MQKIDKMDEQSSRINRKTNVVLVGVVLVIISLIMAQLIMTS